MRILIKGGVWKNTEDEILKAAVMKYGNNAWSRVASLLNRKSAKQCKARWYEWLDPSIKKTEWSKDEEEKLLHLAKLMPNQWRTIAPIVGRTAGQCMEHYEKLLDQVQIIDGNESGNAAEDPRRLRPGEIDPAPETKPARPDPIDMDEDEKEMLSEARARLANTKGKKAKRKLRQRTLDEARRLSVLQKRRELKAAGINSRLGGPPKRKFIDYAREIPFQKVAPTGFYDVQEENSNAKKIKLDPKEQGIELGKLEGRHQREEEERNRAKDKRLMKALYKDNAPLAIMKVAAENDPTTLRRRNPLSLPSPQVSDMELEEIIKIGQHSLMGPPEGVPSAHVTQSLIADYDYAFSKTIPTPMRTPLQEDVIMQEARNLIALRNMTPLNGDELPELYEGTGFGGIAPRSSKLATPNTFLGFGSKLPNATPEHFGMTPSLNSVAATPGGKGLISYTPLRDQFGLNDPHGGDSFSTADIGSIGGQSKRSTQFKEQFINQLKSLPEPEFTYEVSIPQVEDDTNVGGDDDYNGKFLSIMKNKPQDAAEVQAELLRHQKEEQEREFNRRNAVIKRGLPRPTIIDDIAALELTKPSLFPPSKYQNEEIFASNMINTEMISLVRSDIFQFPMESTKPIQGKVKPVYLEQLSDEYLSLANGLISEEVEESMARLKSHEKDKIVSDFNDELDALYKSTLFIPQNKIVGGGHFAIPANKSEMLIGLITQFGGLKARFEKESKRASKLETKLKITSQGYSNRCEALEKNLQFAYDEWNKAVLEKECVTMLSDQEKRTAKRRLSVLKSEVAEAERQEMEMQLKYAQIIKFARLKNAAI
eukprot:gene14993-20168_t